MSESTPDVATQPGDELLLELADDYLRRYRAGEQPTVDEYVSKHPELADRIRELFPAMIAMEQPGPGATVDLAPPTERVGAIDRPLQAAGADRRGRLRRRVHGRAAAAGPPQGGAEGRQAGDGQPPGVGAVRGRTASPGDHGPSEHRQGVRRRRHRLGPAVLRDGAGQRRADHGVLRPESALAARSASSCSPRSATPFSTRTKRASSTATSSRRTCWWRCTTRRRW